MPSLENWDGSSNGSYSDNVGRSVVMSERVGREAYTLHH